MRIKKKTKAGFSLIELLVVATIVIVLTTIGLVSFQSGGRNSRDAKRKADLEVVRQALVLYRADRGRYPIGTSYPDMTQTLIDDDYMTDPAPSDPKDVAPHLYTYRSTAGLDFCICAEVENSENVSGSCAWQSGNKYCIANP